MNEKEYLTSLLKFYPDRGHDQSTRLAECAMGLSGEAGETTDLLKKHIIYGRPLDVPKLLLEMGDVLNYLTKLAHELGTDMATIRELNIAKLEKRVETSPSYFIGGCK